MQLPSRIIAGSFALAGFSAAAIAGLAAGNQATPVLLRAVVAMFVCYLIGLVIGTAATHAVSEHLAQYKRENPVPDSGELQANAKAIKAQQGQAPSSRAAA